MKQKKTFNVQIGSRIQRARRKRGFTQEQMAEAVDVTPQYLSDLERGVTGASLLTLSKICQTLKVSSDYILFEKESPQSPQDSFLVEQILKLPDEQRQLVDQFLEVMQASTEVTSTQKKE